MKIALLGNPNSGKTTLFNALTGSSAKVTNWPGVTVEKRVGVYKKSKEKIEIVDLPGIYSLSPYTPEEIVSRDFILEENPDLIINIVDATSIERGFYLTTQALETDIPLVIALNFLDELEKTGDYIDAAILEKKIGVPVHKISALKKKNIDLLMVSVLEQLSKKRDPYSVLSNYEFFDPILDIKRLYDEKQITNSLFRSIKYIERDRLEKKKHPEMEQAVEEAILRIKDEHNIVDIEATIADSRYKYISSNYTVELKKTPYTKSTSRAIDKILTHKYFSIPIFILIMLTIFHITFSENFLFLSWAVKNASFSETTELFFANNDGIYSPGVIIFKLVEDGWGLLIELVESAMPADTWYTSLVVEGVLSGVGAVISFIPLILIMFFFISLLEDTGYMARIAFILDRAFRNFGLSGRALIPLITCFGCTVPGIMGTRILEDDSERKRSIFLSPFFSCGAKLPIWAAFAGVFALNLKLNATLVVTAMYLIGIIVAAIASLFLKNTFLKGDTPPFVMEIPKYRKPQAATVFRRIFEQLKHYVLRAGSVITASIIVIWGLTNLSFTKGFVPIEEGILATISKGLSFIFVPLGWGYGNEAWKLTVAVFVGLIAKEMVIAALAMFAGMGDSAADAPDLSASKLGTHSGMAALMLGVGGMMFGVQTAIPAMFAFLTYNLLTIPCMATVAAARAEFIAMEGKKKGKLLTLVAVAFWLIVAYFVSALVFWIGMFIVVAKWFSLIPLVVILGVVIVLLLIRRQRFKGLKV